MADEKVQKVFHASEYDVMCLRRDFDFTFCNLFDTMWAARILGWQRVGLGDILQEQFGITLDKKWQRHNWGKRPIEPAALAYAQFDTHYLLRLRDVQLRELQQRDRLAEAREVFSDLSTARYNGHEFTPDDIWSIKGVWDLGGRAHAILRQLVILRDREARRQNRPAFKVIGDKTLLQIAARAPRTLDEMRGIDGMTAGQQQRYGAALLEAVARGRKDAVPAPPHRTPDRSGGVGALRSAARLAQAGRGSARCGTGCDCQQRRLDGDRAAPAAHAGATARPALVRRMAQTVPTARRYSRSLRIPNAALTTAH